MKKIEYPCDKCIRVDTENCTWRKCAPFVKWFKQEWHIIRVSAGKENENGKNVQ